MSMRDAALAYARHGFHVFPCNPTSDKARGSKAPLVPKESAPGAKDGGHWLASTDADQISQWWSRNHAALVGFPTGLRTGTVVIDLDPRTVPLGVMLAALTAWCGGGLAWVDPETGELVEPAVVETQSGGLHFYFRYEGTIGNRGSVFSGFVKSGEASTDLDHIDVRGEGGYVIAPPSVMDNGNAYRWLRRPQRAEPSGWVLPPMPPALRRVVTREREPRVARAAPVRSYRGEGNQARLAEKKIEGILRSVATAPAGQRNQTIFWGACRLGEMVLAGCLSGNEARGLMLGNLPSGVASGEPKALSSIERGLSYPGLAPWQPEQRERAA